MLQKLKTKREMGSKPKDYLAMVGETVEKIRYMVNAMTSKMWEIGRVIDEQLAKLQKEPWVRERDKETGQFLEGNFYEDVAKKLNSDVTTEHLRNCTTFFRRYPDLAERVQKTGLSPTHYERLSHLTKDDAEKYEKIASEKKLTVKELREQAMPRRVVLNISEVEDTYHEFTDNLIGLEEAMEKLSASELSVLTKTQINGMLRSVFIFMTKFIPRFAVHLEEKGGKLDPNFKKYIERFI